MGLDQYAYAVRKNKIALEVDFNLDNIDRDDYYEIKYWRKHHDLQGWMHELYESKGGKDAEFNCSYVRLTTEDLLKLKEDVENNSLPQTVGFFFGEGNTAHYKLEDLEFIKSSLDQDEYDIVYTSWW